MEGKDFVASWMIPSGTTNSYETNIHNGCIDLGLKKDWKTRFENAGTWTVRPGNQADAIRRRSGARIAAAIHSKSVPLAQLGETLDFEAHDRAQSDSTKD